MSKESTIESNEVQTEVQTEDSQVQDLSIDSDQDMDVNDTSDQSEDTSENTQESDSKSIPEGVEEDFWDGEKKEIDKDKLLDAYNKEKEKALGLRRKLSQKGSVKPPKEISEYEISEEFLAKDTPIEGILKNKALEAGLSKDQFKNFIESIVPDLKEAGVIFDSKQQLNEAEHKKFVEKELSKIDNGQQKLEDVSRISASLVNNEILDKNEIESFNQMIYDAKSLEVAHKLLNQISIKSHVNNELTTGKVYTQAEIDEIMSSDKYLNNDPATLATVRKYYESKFG